MDKRAENDRRGHAEGAGDARTPNLTNDRGAGTNEAQKGSCEAITWAAVDEWFANTKGIPIETFAARFGMSPLELTNWVLTHTKPQPLPFSDDSFEEDDEESDIAEFRVMFGRTDDPKQIMDAVNLLLATMKSLKGAWEVGLSARRLS